MRSIIIENPGPSSTLTWEDSADLDPAEGELILEARASAINRADLMQRAGLYPPPPGASDVPGLEVAGIVKAVGPGCVQFKEGERVMALLAGGGYASQVKVLETHCMPIPGQLDFTEAAAIPEVFLTAYQALVWLGRLSAGEKVLIHAGGSGVGTAAIQLVKFVGGHPFITASKGKHAACKALGSELEIDYRTEDFAEGVLAATQNQGVQMVLDFVGAPYMEKNISVLGMDGRLIILSMLGGRKVQDLDLGRLFRKRIQIITSTLRNRSDAYKTKLIQAMTGDLLPAFEKDILKPVIDKVYSWNEAEDAHQYVAKNLNTGKVILSIDL